MAIVKITSALAGSPLLFAAPVINQLSALLTDCNHGYRVSGGYVKQGSLWNLGGAMFMANSDTAITGTRSDATTGIKFTVSGDAATVSYGTDAVTWIGSQQGFYDAGNNFYYCGTYIAGDLGMENGEMSLTIPHQTAPEVYTKKWAYKIGESGIYRVKIGIVGAKFDVDTYYFGYAKIYINNNAVGAEFGNNSDSIVYQTKDVFCEENDEIEVYFRGTALITAQNDYELYVNIYSGSIARRTL